jgi:hypothetical protein
MSIEVARKIERATGLSAKWLLQLDLNYRFAHYEPEDDDGVTRFSWATS